MAPPAWERTIDVRVHNFPTGTASPDIASALKDFFATQSFELQSIQQCPGFVARVTFADSAPKLLYERAGEIVVGDVTCPVVVPRPPGPRWDRVVVYWFPFEADNAAIDRELSKYGEVDGVRFQRWTNLPDISTGTRVVRIKRKCNIPRFIIIDGFRCKIWYADQPVICDLCRKEGHRAADCPDKGKCFRCHQSGHVSRNCPNPWGTGPTPAEAATAQVDRAHVARAVSDGVNNGHPPLIQAEDLDLGFENLLDEVVEVVDEGSAVPPAPAVPLVMNDRFSQPDDVSPSGSQSILQNCRSEMQNSNGNVSSINSINNDVVNNEITSDSNSRNGNNGNESNGNTRNGNNKNESNGNNRNGINGNESNGNNSISKENDSNLVVDIDNGSNDGNLSCLGESSLALSQSPLLVDSEMSDVLGSLKRSATEVSSDGTIGEITDSGPADSAAPPPKVSSRPSKKSAPAKGATVSSDDSIGNFTDSGQSVLSSSAAKAVPRQSKKSAPVKKSVVTPGRHFLSSGFSAAARLATSRKSSN